MKKLSINLNIPPNKNMVLTVLLCLGMAWSVWNILSAAPDPGHLWSVIGDSGTEILTASRGGTGTSSLAMDNVLLGNTTGAFKFVASGTVGNVLTSDGTIWASAKSGIANLVTLLYSDESNSSTLTATTTETILKYWVMNINQDIYRFYIWEADVKSGVGAANINVDFVWNFKLNNASLQKSIFSKQLGSTVAGVANGMKVVSTISATSTNALGADANLVLTGKASQAGATYNMIVHGFRIYGVK